MSALGHLRTIVNRPIIHKSTRALLLGEPDAEGRLTGAQSTVELARRKIGFFSKSPSNHDWRWFPTSVPWSGSTTRQ
jgi:hypothetical protein